MDICFDRRPKVELTELGKLVQPYLQEAWEQAQAAKKEAKEYGVKAPMQLNLAIMCTIAPALLIQMFARFRAAHPISAGFDRWHGAVDRGAADRLQSGSGDLLPARS